MVNSLFLTHLRPQVRVFQETSDQYTKSIFLEIKALFSKNYPYIKFNELVAVCQNLNNKLEIAPKLSVISNLYFLYKDHNKFKDGVKARNLVLNDIRANRNNNVFLIDSLAIPRREDLYISSQQKIALRAMEELIKRCYLMISSDAITVFRGGAIFISQPALRKCFEGSCDVIAYHCLSRHYTVTQDPTHIKNPGSVTLQDRMHQLFKKTTSAIGICGGLCLIACSLGYVDEKDDQFTIVTGIATINFVVDSILYKGLQWCGIFASRQ